MIVYCEINAYLLHVLALRIDSILGGDVEPPLHEKAIKASPKHKFASKPDKEDKT